MRVIPATERADGGRSRFIADLMIDERRVAETAPLAWRLVGLAGAALDRDRAASDP